MRATLQDTRFSPAWAVGNLIGSDVRQRCGVHRTRVGLKGNGFV